MRGYNNCLLTDKHICWNFLSYNFLALWFMSCSDQWFFLIIHIWRLTWPQEITDLKQLNSKQIWIWFCEPVLNLWNLRNLRHLVSNGPLLVPFLVNKCKLLLIRFPCQFHLILMIIRFPLSHPFVISELLFLVIYSIFSVMLSAVHTVTSYSTELKVPKAFTPRDQFMGLHWCLLLNSSHIFLPIFLPTST